MAQTLLSLAGADMTPASPQDATLLLIDMQAEYENGPLQLPDAAPATDAAARTLARWRAEGGAVIHVAHAGAPGGLFDRAAPRGAILAQVAPQDGEPVVEKRLPNAFAGTALAGMITTKKVMIIGFMTHMCVSSTARAALDLGFGVTIEAAACATRDLPDPVGGGVLCAGDIHRHALAGLADRFAIIV